MIQLLPHLRILLAYQPVDFRKGIDGLIALCRNELASDVYQGDLYVFRNKRGTALKILAFDGVGMWMCTRRFSEGKLRWWPNRQSNLKLHPLQAQQLSVLLYNGLPDQASFVPAWRALPQHHAARPSSASPVPAP